MLEEVVRVELEMKFEVEVLLDEEVDKVEDTLLEATEELVEELVDCTEKVVEVLAPGNKRPAETTIITMITTTTAISLTLAIPFLLEIRAASSAFLKPHITQASG